MKEIESAFKINSLLKNNEKYLLLKQVEKEMLDDESTFILLNVYHKKQDEYNEALKYQEYGSDIEKARKELHQTKMLVDTNPFVKKYNEALKDLNSFLEEVSDLLLEGVIK